MLCGEASRRRRGRGRDFNRVRAESIELRQHLGGVGFVASAQVREVVIRDVAGRVLELELAKRTEREPFLLDELLASIGRKRQQPPRGPVPPERPEREHDGGDSERDHGDQHADHAPVSISRLIRSLIAGSMAG